jgi:hypothetical protein
VGKPERKRRLGRPRYRWVCRPDSHDAGKGPMAGFCEHRNQPLVAIKFWEYLEWLSNWWLLRKGSAPWA